MDDNTEKLLTYGAIGLGVYFVGKALINSFGGNGGTPAATVAQQATPAAGNPFSPGFQPYLDAYYNGGASTLCSQYGGATGLKSIFTATGGQMNGSQSDLMVYAETIYSSFGYIAHDDNTVLAVFQKIPDQISVAFIADYLNCVYQEDLLNLLNEGAWEITTFLTSGLSNTNQAAIISNVKALPEGDTALPAPPASLTAGSTPAGTTPNSSVPWYDQLLSDF